MATKTQDQGREDEAVLAILTDNRIAFVKHYRAGREAEL